MKISNKKSVQYLLSLCKQLEISQIVICPGSRNLPLILSFSNDSFFTIHSCIDERVAGFFALGIVKSNLKPAIVITTSGSAAINLAPAMAEAFYQILPLIAITADRPTDIINKGENQTIIQKGLYKHYVSLEMEIDENISLPMFEKKANEIYQFLNSPNKTGNLHINMPFSTPLNVAENLIGNYQYEWNDLVQITPNRYNFNNLAGQNVIIYLSSIQLSSDLKDVLDRGIEEKNWVVIAECTSQYYHPKVIQSIDLILNQKNSNLKPDVLITIGGQIISKTFKSYIQNLTKLKHIDISTKDRDWDLLSSDFQFIKSNIKDSLHSFWNTKHCNPLSYSDTWSLAQSKANKYHQSYFASNSLTEFNLINQLINQVELNSVIYWGNSSIIRYANWSPWQARQDILHYANRGVSGIEGVLASAIGLQNQIKSNSFYCVLGDVSLLYETNSLQILHSCENFNLIVLNNHGGKIFENIHDLDDLENHQSLITPHHSDFSYISTFVDIQYIKVKDLESFQALMSQKKGQNGRFLIEIDFPENSNSDWNQYFNLKS